MHLITKTQLSSPRDGRFFVHHDYLGYWYPPSHFEVPSDSSSENFYVSVIRRLTSDVVRHLSGLLTRPVLPLELVRQAKEGRRQDRGEIGRCKEARGTGAFDG
jgi:hypothetical protein